MFETILLKYCSQLFDILKALTGRSTINRFNLLQTNQRPSFPFLHPVCQPLLTFLDLLLAERLHRKQNKWEKNYEVILMSCFFLGASPKHRCFFLGASPKHCQKRTKFRPFPAQVQTERRWKFWFRVLVLLVLLLVRLLVREKIVAHTDNNQITKQNKPSKKITIIT